MYFIWQLLNQDSNFRIFGIFYVTFWWNIDFFHALNL